MNSTELVAAKRLAREALDLLQQMEKELKSARNWGYYDMLGGGFFSSMIKRGKVRKAEALQVRIRFKLKELQGTLYQLKVGAAPQINISGLDWFLDIVFDNILFDWLTQTKIQESLRQVQEISNEVRQVVTTLNQIAN